MSEHVPNSLDRLAAWSWRLLVVGAAVALVVFVLVELRVVVLPLIAGIVVASILDPSVRRLRDMGWPPLLAVWTVLMGALAIVVLAVFLVVPRVPADMSALAEALQSGIDRVETWLVSGPLGLSESQVASYRQAFTEQFRANASKIVAGVLSGAVVAVEIVVGVLLTLPILFFLLKDGRRFRDRFVGVFREENQAQARAVLQSGWRTIGSYLRGLTIVALVDATLIGIGLLILGVPLVLPLAALTFLGAYLPIVGAFLSGLVAVLVALVDGGLVQALLVLALVVGVQQVDSHGVAPIVLGRAVDLHPLVIILALAAGGVVAGIVGAFLAVPVAAVTTAMVSEWRRQRSP